MNLTKFFKIISLLHILFFFNCLSEYFSRSFPISDSYKYIHMNNEYNPEAQALFQKKVSSDGKSTVLESGNLLIPKNKNEIRVLKIEMKDGLTLSATDQHTTQFKKEKSNVLYFMGMDVQMLYRQSNISQAESYGESDLVDISFQEGEFTTLSDGDKISIQLNPKNQHKLASNTIDLYQIKLDDETVVFYWKLKKIKGNQYIVEQKQEFQGKADIHKIHSSMFKYHSYRTFHFVGKTITIILDIVTFPIQLPFWLIYLIGLSGGVR